jgi:hypothetical protein
MLEFIRLLHTNMGLRVAASVVLLSLLGFMAFVTGLPVVLCFKLFFQEGASVWVLNVGLAALLFCIYALSYPIVGLHDLWTGAGMFQEYGDDA